MPYDPDREVDPAKLRTFMERTKVGEPDLYRRAFRRLCALTDRNADDPLEAEFDACVAALEQLYWEESGKHKRARRITDKRGRDGTVETFRYLVMKRDPSDGFRHLVANRLAEFTAEYVVVRYHDRFSAEAVACARRRLAEFGIEPPREAAILSAVVGVDHEA